MRQAGDGSMEGWRSMLGTDIDDENAPTETYLFCPDCADRSSARLEGITSGRRTS